MATQTTPLQHADNFFVKPDFCGYGFVSGSGTHRERQQTKNSYNKPKGARPQSTLRASLARGFAVCLHINQAIQPERLNRPGYCNEEVRINAI